MLAVFDGQRFFSSTKPGTLRRIRWLALNKYTASNEKPGIREEDKRLRLSPAILIPET
jgi:hypothetical protein